MANIAFKHSKDNIRLDRNGLLEARIPQRNT